MPIPVTGYAHIHITVHDIGRSRAFYDQIFGFPVEHELPPDADEETKARLWFLFGGVIYRLPDGLFGLRPAAPGDDLFSADRVGLDHLSFAVPTHADLEAAVRTLDAKGVAHDGIKDTGGGYILEFRDPDGIALELFAPKG